MNARIKIISTLALVMFVCLMMTACKAAGTKEMVKGRVVDAETGKPVQGAAVAIYWVHEKFSLPGLGSNRDRLGTTETLTDAQGNFTIPRYIGYTYYMGVYKKGYVCWNSERIFNPLGKTHRERYKKRRWHRVKDGMKIQLEPMPVNLKTEQRERHAYYTTTVELRLWTRANGPFETAIQHEEELHRKSFEKKSKEK